MMSTFGNALPSVWPEKDRGRAPRQSVQRFPARKPSRRGDWGRGSSGSQDLFEEGKGECLSEKKALISSRRALEPLFVKYGRSLQ